MDRSTRLQFAWVLAVALIGIVLAGCGGDGGGGGTGSGGDDGGRTGGGAPVTTTPMTGTVAAPGGVIALNAPTGFKRFLVEFFGRSAIAALPGMNTVPNVPVALIQIDSTGNKVADIASGTTDNNGAFTLNVPATLVPGPQYVVRASGAATLDRMVSGLSSQDVDPATHATKVLVLQQLGAANANIQTLRSSQVAELANQVAGLVVNVNTAGKGAADLASALSAAASADEGVSSSIGNLTEANGIAGTVSDRLGAPLAGIKVVVLDFRQWVVRARAVTDANGNYSANLASADYIVGAMNFTEASTAASEWWTCNDSAGGPVCGSSNQFGAGKVTVGAATTAVNFKLEAGARIQGSITASDTGLGLPGVQVALRDFLADEPAASQDAQNGGTFRINVRPGTYTVGARNKTLVQAYSGGEYNGPVVPAGGSGTATNGGGTIVLDATPVTVAAGSTYSINLPLVLGGLVTGKVTEGASPVAGISVRFFLLPADPDDAVGAFVEGLRTDNLGNYGLWVRPAMTYAVRSRGQTASPTTVTASGTATVNFGATVGRVKARVLGPDGAPLSQVKVEVYDTSASNAFQGFEVSNGDGSVEIFAQPVGNYLLTYKVDNGSTAVGSAIHNNNTFTAGQTTPQTGLQLTAGAPVNFDPASPKDVGDLGMPAGGELKGTVRVGGAPTKNIIVQVRGVGAGGVQRFLATRTSSDGSYSISLPAGTYARICAFVPGATNVCPTTASSAGLFASIQNVTVTANQSNTATTISIP